MVLEEEGKRRVRTFCVHSECSEMSKLEVTFRKGCVVYSMCVCFEHGKWAEEYLKEHVLEEEGGEE